tara:strand:+ start:836 stop:1171 length:336 start_codon:yes stop_codon:yes gene_type:complete
MRYQIFIFFILLSCSSESVDDFQQTAPTYKNVNYVTITNESTGGGSQFFYLKSGFSISDADSCYCDSECSKEVIEVAELQFDDQSMNFRFKLTISDNFTTKSTNDWCTKYN